jgi:hypothetical protein
MFSGYDGDEVYSLNTMTFRLRPFITKPGKYDLANNSIIEYQEVYKTSLTSDFIANRWYSSSGFVEVTAVNGDQIEGKFDITFVHEEKKKVNLHFAGTFRTVLEKY